MSKPQAIIVIIAICFIMFFAYLGGKKNLKANFLRPHIIGVVLAIIVVILLIFGNLFMS